MSRRLMDEMHSIMRRRHYSIRTERSYTMGVKRYVTFHKMKSRDDLRNGEKKIVESGDECAGVSIQTCFKRSVGQDD